MCVAFVYECAKHPYFIDCMHVCVFVLFGYMFLTIFVISTCTCACTISCMIKFAITYTIIILWPSNGQLCQAFEFSYDILQYLEMHSRDLGFSEVATTTYHYFYS
jgi:hypothetical protein